MYIIYYLLVLFTKKIRIFNLKLFFKKKVNIHLILSKNTLNVTYWFVIIFTKNNVLI